MFTSKIIPDFSTLQVQGKVKDFRNQRTKSRKVVKQGRSPIPGEHLIPNSVYRGLVLTYVVPRLTGRCHLSGQWYMPAV